MIRATIMVEDPIYLQTAYLHLQKMSDFNIVKIKNKIKSPLQNLTFNVIF